MRSTVDLKARLNEMGIEPKKAFGQNFLINLSIIERIVETASLQPCKDLIEIGPGLGALTEPMLKRGMTPRLIELDRELIKYWRERGLHVVDQDALKLDWNSLELKAPALLVSNLPYQISTSLVIDRCFGPEALKCMVLMFQKEVAERLMAAPRTKAYGLLSVMAQLHFEMSRVCDAAPQDFYPAPKVASRVLLFKRRPEPGLGLPFLKFIKAAFAFRRKFLAKNIKGMVDKSKLARIEPALEETGHGPKTRAEELSPTEFAALYHKIYVH